MNTRSVVDFHCDVLSKMTDNVALSFVNDCQLDVTYERMKSGGVVLQCFAIYLMEKWGHPRFERILQGIDVFRNRIVPAGMGLNWLQYKEEVKEMTNNKPWGMLSIEGADGLEGELFNLTTAYELGVRFLGVTWNYANWAADGVLEKRNGGFTNKGRQLVELCNEIGMLLDVSHVSQAGFWELTELSKRPFIASHSNAYDICSHVRNLDNQQIKAIVDMDGRIGLTFVPWFVKEGNGEITSKDIIPHIEHICELGADKHLMFGSDFDGIDSWITDLNHPGKYPAFIELLLKYYKEEQVTSWVSGNAITYLETYLPSRKG
ncbi:dipeptidase [Paenibacillus crassostreae]|uniref:Membrane dipeptidase n=1 Tax=Paenibacillus crassostreae TaxID=1763538 RepID=A0A167FKW3_9BACL|nr:dipeptidase [Paenibacillus crassostreae]AOZ94815.1 membrane dipeptidase [Paenibacillus crassostreae]OAB76667.1 membrane dipeptidase [Paenibacillus crassostreae]